MWDCDDGSRLLVTLVIIGTVRLVNIDSDTSEHTCTVRKHQSQFEIVHH
jgi:hypothetical protein